MSITDATCKYDRDVNFGSGRYLVCFFRMLSLEFYNLPIAFSLSVLSFRLSVLSLGSSLSLWDVNLCLPVIVGNWQCLICLSGMLSMKPWKCASLPANWVHRAGDQTSACYRLPKCKRLKLMVSGQCISTHPPFLQRITCLKIRKCGFVCLKGAH